MSAENKAIIKEFVANSKSSLKEFFSEFSKKNSRKPSICIVQVGENKASESYIKGKVKDGTEMDVDMCVVRFPRNISEEDFLNELKRMNKFDGYDGIMVQLPVPKQINVEKINMTLDPKKDVDGFTKTSECDPCTPLGILKFLENMKVEFSGKNAVVIGRSEIVGKPMAKMLLDKNCTVTVCHSKTPKEELKRYVENADIIVVAAGKRGILNNEFKFKKDCVIMDVGINVDEDNHLHGDCEGELPVKFQSPVPGGVGLLTRLALFFNLKKLIEDKDNGKL